MTKNPQRYCRWWEGTMRTLTTFRFVPATLFATAYLCFMAIFTNQQPLAQLSERPNEPGAQSNSSTAGLLDGLRFKAGIVKAEDGSGNALEDTLTFRNGEFSSAICKRYNFTASPYWVRTEGETVHFLAELDSPTDGKMVWKGTITGDTLKGTMHWTKERWYWTCLLYTSPSPRDA